MTNSLSRRKRFARSGLILGAATLDLFPSLTGAQSRPEKSRRRTIRLIANENPYGPGPKAREALIQSIGDSWKYAFHQKGELKELIAEREGVTPRQVMVAAGSGEILKIAALLYGRSGGDVISAKPTSIF